LFVYFVAWRGGKSPSFEVDLYERRASSASSLFVLISTTCQRAADAAAAAPRFMVVTDGCSWVARPREHRATSALPGASISSGNVRREESTEYRDRATRGIPRFNPIAFTENENGNDLSGVGMNEWEWYCLKISLLGSLSMHAISS